MARCSPSPPALPLLLSATAEDPPRLCWCSPPCESQILALGSAALPSHTLSGIFFPHRSLRIALPLLRSSPCSFRCTAAASDIYVVLRGSMAQSLVHYSNPGQVHHRDLPSTRRPCLHHPLSTTFSSPLVGRLTAHPGSSAFIGGPIILHT